MSDEYQLRKDIDRLINDVYDLETGALQLTSISDFNELSELVKDTSSLTNLETSLDNFSNDLDKYNDELEAFSGQLTEYDGELTGFTGQLQGFTTAINNLKNWMYGYNPLDPSITYENPSSDSIKGMIGVLQGLLEEIEAGDGIVLENLGRLKDHLQAFSGTLAEFKQYLISQGVDVSTLDDSVLSLILEINKNIAVIDEHEQTINEVDQTIGSPATATTPATGFYKKFDDGDAIMTDLDGRASQLEDTVGDENSGLVKDTNDLIDSVGDENSGLIKDTNDIIDTIGEPATTGQSATGMFLAIDNAQETADAVDGVATLIKQKIGYDAIQTPLQSQLTTHNGQISNALGGVSSVKTKIGYDLIDDVDLQTQINGIKSVIQNNNENQAIWVINDSTPSPQEWLILMYDYGVDIDNIHYAYSLAGDKAFIRNRSSWEEYDIEQLIDEVDFICGIAYDVRTVSTVTEYEVWDSMLSCLYDVFYEKDEHQWVVSDYDNTYARNSVYALTDWLSGSFQNLDVGDYKNQHRINREIDAVLGEKANTNDVQGWNTIALSSYAILYVNEALHLCRLHYDRTFNSASADTFYTWSDVNDLTTYIPLDYRPSVQSHGSINQAGVLYVNPDGEYGGKFAVSWNSARHCIGDCWWHYEETE